MSRNVKRTCSWNFYRIQVWTLSSSLTKYLQSIQKKTHILKNQHPIISNHLGVSSNQHLVFSKLVLHSIQTRHPHWRKAPPTWRKLLGTFHAKTLLPWHQKWHVNFFWVYIAVKNNSSGLGVGWFCLPNSDDNVCMYVHTYVYMCQMCMDSKFTFSLTFSCNLSNTNLEPVNDDVQS